MIYDDALAGGWTDQTWDASVDLAQTAVVHAGDRAVSVTVQGNGAWAPKASSPVDTAPYVNFSFYIHGGTTGYMDIVAVLSTDSGDTWLPAAAVNDYVDGGQVVPGEWRLVTIPLTALGAESKLIDRFAIHDDTGSAQPTFYIDDVRFDNTIPEPPPGGQHRISIDQDAHETYGLHYPVTYMFSFPPGSTALRAEYRYGTGDSWVALPMKTSDDFFNGIAAARFDYDEDVAYLSVPFSTASHSIYLRVLNGQTTVEVTYLGMPLYYDDRQAAVTVTLDDVNDDYIEDFIDAVDTLSAYQVNHSVGAITAQMGSYEWSTTQEWLDQGYTEVVSHTRDHPCDDDGFQEDGGYTYQIVGSRDDLIDGLDLPAPFVPAYVQPCGFDSEQQRAAFIEGRYLIERSTFENISDGFASWSDDGAYNQVGRSVDTWNWPDDDQAERRDEANRRFDRAFNNGGIYHLMDHPWLGLWTDEPYLEQHVDYIANRADVWYAGFGELYLYHYVQERGKVSVTKQ